MAAGDWNILAGRLDGNGSVEILEDELPINISSLSRTLSAPSSLSGSITDEVRRLKKDGKPIFVPGSTVLMVEASDLLRGYTFYGKPTFNGREWSIDGAGLSSYPIGQPYLESISFVREDPLNIVRHIWDWLQGQPYGNIGVTVDRAETTQVIVGTPSEVITERAETGPRRLNWWETHDLGGEIDSYAQETPFDWIENISWGTDGLPKCHIDFEYPNRGVRRNDITGFVLGQNLATEPAISTHDDFNGVHVLGAGDGRTRMRGYAGVSDNRIRRVRVVEDESLRLQKLVDSRARDELGKTRGQYLVDSLDVFNHPNAPIRGINLGDSIPIYAETDHATVDSHVRVIGIEESPQNADMARLTVIHEGMDE